MSKHGDVILHSARDNNSLDRLPMDKQVREYRETLEAAMRRLQPHITAGRIVGSDMSQFLVIDRDGRGVEIYGDEETGVTIDPAVGDELQGELTYPSFDLALDAAVRWLDGCGWEDLPPSRPTS